MARRARVEYAGAVYHVMDRGDRREAIFRDDEDRTRFLKTLGEACGRTGWRIHAYVLMGNHYHIMLETPAANLVEGMSWFQTTVTVRHNRRHGLAGHLFQGRYKAVVVDPEEKGYFAILSDYIHLNPVRARLVSLNDRLLDYPWSSYPSYVSRRGRAVWFEPQTVLGEMGFEDNAEGRRGYAQRMRRRAVQCLSKSETEALAQLRSGWCLGGAGFRERMLGLLDGCQERLMTAKRRDAAVERDHGVKAAQKIFEAGLRVFGLQGNALRELPKGDERKAVIALLIHSRTGVSNTWLAKALHLGHASRISHCVRSIKDVSLIRKLERELDSMLSKNGDSA